MPDSLGLGATFVDYWGVVPLSGFVVFAYMRDWIVSGSRLRRAEADRDKWESIALEAIRASATAIVPAAETVHKLVSNLPDPGRDREEAGP